MKTTIFLLIAWGISSFLSAQATDVIVIRQVDSLIQVSRALTEQGDFEKAFEIHAVAENIALEKLGRESAGYGSCCFNRGRIFYFKNDYPAAEKWYLDAKSIREKVLGKDHPDYAWCLNNLGILDFQLGAYEKAEMLFVQAKDIWAKSLGKEHPIYAKSLNNLAGLYVEIGDDEKAEHLYLESKSTFEKVSGKEHPDYSNILNNLAGLYKNMGNYEKAEQLYLEANAISARRVGKEHTLYAWTLFNLGILHWKLGNYEKAEPLFIEAKTIWEKLVGKAHPDYGQSLNGLALLYHDMGKYEEAERLFLEANAIWGKSLGKEHAYFAANLNNLAKVYRQIGNYKKAEQFSLEAKEILEKTLGKAHEFYLECLQNLSMLSEKQSFFQQSEPLLAALFSIQQTKLSKSASFLSERELAKYSAIFQKDGDNLVSYLLARPANHLGNLPGMAFDHALFHKGFLLNAATQLNALAVNTPQSAEINSRLKSFRRRLAVEYAKPLAEQKGVAALEEKCTAAEKELTQSVAGYAEAMQRVNWQNVQLALKNGEAAIEFIRFGVSFPKTTDSTMYAALVVLPDGAPPQFVPLFEERQILPLINGASGSNFRKINETYAPAATGKKLYELIWQALETRLSTVRTIYFSPSGLLHRLNLAAIPAASGQIFGFQKNLISRGSTRQLVPAAKFQPPLNPKATAAIFGGIRYETDSARLSIQHLAMRGETRGEAELHTFYLDSTARGGGSAWSYLPGSAREAAAIRQILTKNQYETELDTAFSATEENFRRLAQGKKSPRVLHLATHGFFFPDPKTATRRSFSIESENVVFKMSDNPMMRSGLIFAGANQAWATGRGLENREDGILTAYEISQLDFSGTELAVLSACETGLGELAGNEGVYGLQRAFKIAGVKYLIMSLWKVSDASTREFMTEFYRHWLSEKRAVPDAFRAAQHNLKLKYPDSAYDWAGFVLIE